jgi:4-cresol dehydrogenase (hydroxylating) flavoprotein subunit
VVLADGTVLDTGPAHFPGCRAAYAHKWGIGPAVDGLFTQSNLGIVTRLAIWLSPEPEHAVGFLISVPEARALAELVDRLRPLRLSGTLGQPVHVYNRYRVLGASDQEGRHTGLAGYLNAKTAMWSVPSFSRTFSCRHCPRQPAVVAQGYR